MNHSDHKASLEDLSDVTGAWLLVATFFILYIISMSYLRGTLKSDSAQNLIMALEMGHAHEVDNVNPVLGNGSGRQAAKLYGL